MFKSQTPKKLTAVLLIVMIFLFLVSAELIAILWLNDGHFIFALDDPYIHLALAENIWHGHYGVNIEEFSAPSSSILWPVLLASFTVFASAQWLVLIFNIIVSVVTLIVSCRILQAIQQELKTHFTRQQTILLLLVFMFAVNLCGLTFIGMEHNLQVLLAVIVADGLIFRIHQRKTSMLLIFAIIAAPLIRYESAIISAVALLFLFLHQEKLKSIVTTIIMFVCLGAFSLFLLSLGLHYLPDSILAKSTVASVGWLKLFDNISNNFALPNSAKAIVILLLATWCVAYSAIKSAVNEKRLLAACVAIALLLHLLGGRIGWYFRYEMAMWAFSLPLFFYLYTSLSLSLINPLLQKTGKLLMILIVSLAALESLIVLGSTPLAASNIYHQQYQLHRFITEVYQQPVAVNDLGWTSYQNNNYVLDLWGLGSSKARELRKTSNNAEWMEILAAEHDIELIMIYNNAKWFPQVPKNWLKVAELDVTGPKITTWYPVSFFVRDQLHQEMLQKNLQSFALTLPVGSELHWASNKK